MNSESTPTRRHILVTGAAGGIGRATCMALVRAACRENAAIHLSAAASQAGERLDRLLEDLRALGRAEGGQVTVAGVTGDLTVPAACADIVEQARTGGGDLTALVCNAGASGPGALANLPVAQWDQTFNLNVRAVWLLARAAHPQLTRQRGSITAVASMSGLLPHPGYGAYSPAKAALVMLCRQLAQEWAGDGIRVNTVCPGMIRTPLTEAVYQNDDVRQQREALVPLGRIGRAEDIGDAVVFLSSPAASYITGHDLVVDGGVTGRMLTLIPGRPGKAAVGS